MSTETVMVRFPKELWRRVQEMARSVEETGGGWLARTAERELTGLARGGGSVVEKNEKGARAVDVRVEAPGLDAVETVRPAVVRGPDVPCRRCRVAWRLHQEGTRQNRAGLTGCTTFQDPPSAEGAF